MAIARFVIPFSAGVVAGVLLHKYWPQISAAGRPLLRSGLREGAEFVEKGRTAYWEHRERFSDIIEEIREEEAAGTGDAKAPQKEPPEKQPPGAKGAQATQGPKVPPAEPSKA